MTLSHEKIIAEYRDAGFNRRLHMYLQYPPLRSNFMAIDQSDLKAQQPGPPAGRRYSLTALLGILFSATAGCLKRLI